MLISNYIDIAKKTDHLPKRGVDAKISPILGLVGEIGSLLSEIKKEIRERNISTSAKEPIREELGDIIWYATTLSVRAGIHFKTDVLTDNVKKISRNLHPPDQTKKSIPRKIENFNSYQNIVAKSSIYPQDENARIPYLARIWTNSEELLSELNFRKNSFTENEIKKLCDTLGDVMWYVAAFASVYDLTLDDIVQSNVNKITSLFPIESQKIPTKFFDSSFHPLQRFPRLFDVDFVSPDQETALMLINGVRVGDPLRDNAYKTEHEGEGEIEGYRFHDCIHLAFVAILGWSPVMRAILMRKRKDDPRVDDADDGARAQIVEEMIVKLVHNYAVSTDPRILLRGQKGISVDLLKQIVMLAKGLEVAGARPSLSGCKYWEWHKAIIEGFGVYEKLRRHKGGRVRVDMRRRTITYFRLKKGEAERFPICH